MRSENLLGKTFGQLLVQEKAPSCASGAAWICKCSCGTVKTISAAHLKSGHTKSCGCLKREVKANLKHGMSNKTKTYKTWKEMRQRCMNKNSDKWQWYGGRGIVVCERWNDFEMFLLDMGERPEGMTIDRINPDGNYELSNCRWATSKQQAETNRGCIKKGNIPWNKKGVAR